MIGEKTDAIAVVEKETADLITQSQSLVITNQLEYEDAATYLQSIKKMQKKVEESFNSIIQKAHEVHKEAIAKRDEHLDPLKEVEIKVKKLLVDYKNEQDRKAREEQARLQRLADIEAEKERKRVQAQIDRAAASGKTEKVEALQEKIENIQPIEVPVVAPKVEAVKGLSFRDQWSAEVIDFKSLPNEYKLPNQSMLDKHAQNTKGSIPIPGVKFISKKIPVGRS